VKFGEKSTKACGSDWFLPQKSKVRHRESLNDRVSCGGMYAKCQVCAQEIRWSNWNCKCEIINLIDKDDEALRFYLNLYATIAEDDISNHCQEFSSLESKARFDFRQIEPMVRARVSPRVLEIGPGKGNLASKLAKSSDYFSMDIVDNYLIKIEGKRFLGNIEKVPSELYGSFDLIIACDVLEHVLNEANAWEEMNNLLKKDGILYLRVPHKEPLIHYARFTGTNYPFVHLRSYSKQTIRMNSYAHNFIPLKIRTINFGKYSFAKRNFGIRRFYLQNAQNLREQLKPGRNEHYLNERRHVAIRFAQRYIEKFRLVKQFATQLHTHVLFRGTEIYAILKKG